MGTHEQQTEDFGRQIHQQAGQAMSTAKETGREIGSKVSDAARQAGEGVKRAASEGGVQGQEGKTTKAIEHYTSQIPSGGWLSIAVGAMAASALLQLAGKRETSLFIGQWVPSILIMGLYNKLVKVEGSE